MLTIKQRFMSKVSINPETGCWIWTAARLRSGYGAFGINNRMSPAHRAGYELFVGKIPKGLFACHKCDVRECVNPAHIFLGSQKDNMQDAKAKGRLAPPPNTHTNPEWTAKRIAAMPKGADNHATVYSDNDVLRIHELRATGLGPRAIAKATGFGEMFIQDVIYGRARRYLHPDPAVRDRPTREKVPRGSKLRYKYSDDDVQTVRTLRSEGRTGPEISLQTGLPLHFVSDVITGRSRVSKAPSSQPHP